MPTHHRARIDATLVRVSAITAVLAFVGAPAPATAAPTPPPPAQSTPDTRSWAGTQPTVTPGSAR